MNFMTRLSILSNVFSGIGITDAWYQRRERAITFATPALSTGEAEHLLCQYSRMYTKVDGKICDWSCDLLAEVVPFCLTTEDGLGFVDIHMPACRCFVSFKLV
eukprot:TRINITY_DN1447_c1_g1_i15.p2 TRINITY_DN1447_c1_g1~~TRINITY_DN1447_c1_g1_i15.p2  ORF type:complete len:103 (+),score=17.28 TRINITY_DN1447_c1_g1_i15:317-625(+)